MFVVAINTAIFTISPINNDRTNPFHSTKLFFLKGKVTTSVALNKGMLVTSAGKTIDHPLTTHKDVIKKFSYDTIQNLIDASWPYYNLKMRQNMLPGQHIDCVIVGTHQGLVLGQHLLVHMHMDPRT